MSASNPIESSKPGPSAAISSESHAIAGILTNIYGLSELPAGCDSVACLWLLHPRLQDASTMAPKAVSMIQRWNAQRSPNAKQGLIAVSFDQRNHGSRLVKEMANEDWRHGNGTHAQDMFGMYHGTVLDTSLLMDQLPSYVLCANGDPQIRRHFVFGISLGGHCAWQVLFGEPRVEAAVVIIGCPDYMRLMKDRARLSKLETYTSSNGANFYGSKDFPVALIETCQKFDPKGLLFGLSDVHPEPSLDEQKRLGNILDEKIKGKSVLVCSGGADKLIPYHCSAPFLDFLKKAAKGWYGDKNLYIEDKVYDGVGHAFSKGMAQDAERFIMDLMQGKDPRGGRESSRI